MYKIGELAKLSGVSADTLRYYEKHALLVPNSRTVAGYRLYNEQSLQAIHFIIKAKRLGFTLKGISELLALRVDKKNHACSDVKDLTEAKLVEVEMKLLELQSIKQALLKLNSACDGGPDDASHCTILKSLDSLI